MSGEWSIRSLVCFLVMFRQETVRQKSTEVHSSFKSSSLHTPFSSSWLRLPWFHSVHYKFSTIVSQSQHTVTYNNTKWGNETEMLHLFPGLTLQPNMRERVRLLQMSLHWHITGEKHFKFLKGGDIMSTPIDPKDYNLSPASRCWMLETEWLVEAWRWCERQVGNYPCLLKTTNKQSDADKERTPSSNQPQIYSFKKT